MTRRTTILGALLAAVAAASLVTVRERRWLAAAVEPPVWLPLDARDDPGESGVLDLRWMNEGSAGDGGFIGARDGRFVHGDTGAPVRFWGVNGPPRDLTGAPLRAAARMLSRRGVNLVRIHAGYFDARGEVDHRKVAHALEVVEVLRAEGIYSHFSIYYPLWMAPPSDSPLLEGYDGRQHPFAALMFNPTFQARYRDWWRALLQGRLPGSGRRLVDEPAVAALEIQNEDSLLFPTLDSIPEQQRAILERQFGSWLLARHGSIEAALRTWGGKMESRDSIEDGRVAVRPLWRMARDRTRRDRDTVRFLVETETRFYRETHDYLRSLGFRGVIGTSNWHTADDRVLGPLEKLVATGGDFVDRHAYFGAGRRGDHSSWSLRPGQAYVDRSALRFESEDGRGGLSIDNPVTDTRYSAKPTMLSEVSWERPNRFRSEAPLYLAAYGALQDTGAIVQFHMEDVAWTSRIRGIATPWPITTPGQLGQFPAAAVLYRLGLVSTGPVAARVHLGLDELWALEGLPPTRGAAVPELVAGVETGDSQSNGQVVDPLLHHVGRVDVEFGEGASSARVLVDAGLVDPVRRTVRSATGELWLDFGVGALVIDAPQVQGVVGALASRATWRTGALQVTSPMETGAIVAVTLDGKPLSASGRILLQVMSEEQATGFRAEEEGRWRRRLVEPGEGAWLVREIRGTVRLDRPDASTLRVTALDLAWTAGRPLGTAASIELQPAVLHYLIEK